MIIRGPYTNIWGNPKIGETAEIGAFAEIGDGVVVGERVKVGAYAFLCPGVTIEDDVFIGPRVTFTNDTYPPSPKEEWKKTVVKRGASIGAAATILAGVTIGEGSLVGAGAVVTRNVTSYTVVVGSPAIPLSAVKSPSDRTMLRLYKAMNFTEEAI